MKKATTRPPGVAVGNPRPLTITQRVDQLNKFREQYNPLRGLTLRRAVSLAEDYFRGDMADLQWAFFFIEQTDADLLALLEMRLGRLLEMEWDIVASKDADEALATAQSDHLREKFDAVDNLDEAIEHLAMAAFRGYAHAEKIFADGDLVHLEIVDQWNVVRDGLRGPWKYNPEARMTNFAALPADALMPPEQFLFREVRRPINRLALFKFVRANLAEKDWDAFVEIFGFFGGVVIGPPDVQPEKATEFEDAARKLAEGGSGFLPHGSQYMPNEAAKGAHPFKERLDHLSEKLVLAGTGGKLTMLTESGSGTLAGGAHAAVFEQIASAEARRISEVCNRQLAAGWLEERFPGQPAVAYFRLAAEKEDDMGDLVEQISKLFLAGFELDEKEVSERTGFTVTRKPPAPPVSPSPFGGPRAVANRVRNRASVLFAAQVDAAFRAESLAKLSTAQAAALAPLTDRLAAIANLPDDRLDSALVALQADLPRLARTILTDDATREAWEQILGTALASGAASAAAERSPEGRAALSAPTP